ncbi:MAG: serine kinase [Bacteroidales bacterium]|nr:serine kinase [Bacteroidales bacterium]
MKIRDIVKILDLKVISGEKFLEREVTGGYAGDLLSDALANSKKGNIWVTLQIHQNIIAVASSKELSCIIIVTGRKPEKETLKKAQEEKIPVMISKLLTYEVVGRLYEIGIR